MAFNGEMTMQEIKYPTLTITLTWNTTLYFLKILQHQHMA